MTTAGIRRYETTTTTRVVLCVSSCLSLRKKNIMSLKLTNSEQLVTYQLLQLGSKSDPCRVQFGRSDEFGSEKRWRDTKMRCNEDDSKILTTFDESNSALHNYISECDGTECIKVKVSDTDTKVSHLDGSTGSLGDLRVDTNCLLLCKPRKWTLEGETGYSLRAYKILIVPDVDEDVEFDLE